MITSQSSRINEFQRWHNANFTCNQFTYLLYDRAERIMARRGIVAPYIVDDYNKNIINQMYLYILGSPKCEWDLNKGLFLGGKVGCGKTLLMQVFTSILQDISGYVIEMIPSRMLGQLLLTYGIEHYVKRPLFIDELGRENLQENHYGRIIRPFEEIISYSYEYGTRKFFTSNFTPERLGQGYDENGNKIGYGQYILDRIIETCNIAVLPGESRRR